MICPCCTLEVAKLVTHHWIEQDGSYHHKDVCVRCNLNLQADNLGSKINHVLPPWPIQTAYVRNKLANLPHFGPEYLIHLQSTTNMSKEVTATENAEATYAKAFLSCQSLFEKLDEQVTVTGKTLRNMREEVAQLRSEIERLRNIIP